MCRNITTLRGLEPVATDEEIEAAARQYVRKISGVQKTSAATEEAFEKAVAVITAASHEVLEALPPLNNPPPPLPPRGLVAAAKAGGARGRGRGPARRGWDSNPRWVAPHTLSKRADSAALASLPDVSGKLQAPGWTKGSGQLA